MSRNEPARWRKVPIQLAVAAAVVTGIGGAIAGAAIANDDDDIVEVAAASGSQTERTSSRIDAREQTLLRAIVAKMPAGWPATEVMRQATEQPHGDADARERWQQAAELMPSGWPATDVMRAP